MKSTAQALLVASIATSLSTPLCLAAAKIEMSRSETDKGFKLDKIPPPSSNDAATNAKFTLIDGTRDGNGAEIAALHDGRVPAEANEPSKNFFLQSGSGGQIAIDLGKPVSIKSVNSYSWHPDARGPQVYKLYAAKGDEKNFSETPKRGADPRTAGWIPIAKVDTRRKGKGGQFAASISDQRGFSLGTYRHLLFEIAPTAEGDSQSNTFFSEIDVVDSNGPAAQPFTPKLVKTYPAPDGKFKYIVDYTIAPDMTKWVEAELIPMVYQWYPKMATMLPSNGYSTPETVILEFRDDMGGTPAYAAGNKLSMSLPWFRDQLQGEAKGCVIHELVHIVQNYWRAGTTNPNPSPTPGWVTEGIPDYIRWFIYEPQAKGAEITRGNLAGSHYDGSYRTSANFLNWVVETYDKEFVRKLNAAAREGKYSDKVWQDSTGGKTAAELGEEWKEANAKRLGI